MYDDGDLMEIDTGMSAGFRKPGFKKKSPTHWVLLRFWIFYLKEQLGSLLVDLAHQLSFYLDSPVLWII